MASPSDIPKIQSNINLNQQVASESSKIDKDRKENPHEQPEQQKEEPEKDSVELSQKAQARLENKEVNPSDKSKIDLEENEDEPGRNIDFKA